MLKIDETITVATYLTCGLVLTRGRFFYNSQFAFFTFFTLFSWQICAFFQTKLYFAWIKTLKIDVF